MGEQGQKQRSGQGFPGKHHALQSSVVLHEAVCLGQHGDSQEDAEHSARAVAHTAFTMACGNHGVVQKAGAPSGAPWVGQG